MNEQQQERHPVEEYGPFYNKSDLDNSLQLNLGLVSFVTQDGYELCPVDQFIQDDGNLKLRPHLSAAWQACREVGEQMGDSALETLVLFHTPQDAWQGRSWWDILTEDDPTIHEARLKAEIVAEAKKRASEDGITLCDPRTILPTE